MRIALVSPGYAPFGGGGVEVVVEQTARALVVGGDKVEVWTPLRHLASRQSETRDGVTVRRFASTSSRGFPFSSSLIFYARNMAHRFDVVHVHNYHSSVALSLLAIPPDVPTVFSPHYHGGGHTVSARLAHLPYGSMGRRMFRRCAFTVAVSEAEQELLRRDFAGQLGRTAVVHNGTDAHDIVAAAPWPEPVPTVLVLGRLEPHKRVDLAIAGFESQHAPGNLVIIGDGPDRPRLQAMAGRSRRRDDIRFLGRLERSEVLRWLRSARGLISMSEREAFGLVALEAATGGATALLSDLPAHREVARLASTIEILRSPADAGPAIARVLSTEVGTAKIIRSWSEVAADYRSVYETAGAHRRSRSPA